MERETQSPIACPYTVTVRRKPRRKVRPPSPGAAADAPGSAIRSFPTDEILSIQLPQNPSSSSVVQADLPDASPSSDSLKVFLRIRPQIAPGAPASQPRDLQSRASRATNAWPQVRTAKGAIAKEKAAAAAAKKKKQKQKQKDAEVCLSVLDDHSVTLTAPQALLDLKRRKSEVFRGFSRVFSADSSQEEVHEKMMSPLVEDFLRGRSGMLAALGPSGSGKSHTVFGSPREPGMVPLALRQIFKQMKENDLKTSRLKVFLRIRPQIAPGAPASQPRDLQSRASRATNAWPQVRTAKGAIAKEKAAAAAAKKKKQKQKQKDAEVCLSVLDDHSVTLTAPQALLDLKRRKSEVFRGFSRVFSADSSQEEVHEKMMSPLVEDFLRGRSGMLAALGPSGSGKSHTVFGSPREPGMVPLALRQIFKQMKENDLKTSRLKVFLRIRPQIAPGAPASQPRDLQSRASRATNAWPQVRTAKGAIAKEKAAAAAAKKKKQKQKQKDAEVCLSVLDDHSVTLTAPQALLDLKRRKSEVFRGFSRVFSADSSQEEVHEKMMSPLVEDFLRGRSGMLAALGPSGSGKSHTVFGSPREPGMVPLALRQIFKQMKENDLKTSRSFYMSMFEISSEGGKSERLLDLSPEGADFCTRQSNVKGLREVIVSDHTQAESIIACGMLKRSTATTYLNSQSSRSHCVINICYVCNNISGELGQPNSSVLTIVDLAGSEKEKRTGHQGARLIESNFINNTSMVFGSCLRSLLEHQKNPKRPLQKHFQNSMLTRYLRDYLEGKKHMALILTVRSAEDDYLDTSFLLRQASPYMEIKFNHAEEPSNFPKKRHVSIFPRIGQHKRTKLSKDDASVIERCINADEDQSHEEGLNSEQPYKTKASKFLVQHPEVYKTEVNDGASREVDCINCNKKERSSQILQSFSKALWSVLKQYNEKLKVVENEAHSLREDLKIEKEKNFDLEKKLRDSKSSCLHNQEVSAEAFLVNLGNDSESRFSGSPELRRHVSAAVHVVVGGKIPSNVEVEDLKSGHASCEGVLAQTSLVNQDNIFECESTKSSEHGQGSSNIYEVKLNAEVDNLKPRHSSCEEPAVENPFIKVENNNECKFSGSAEFKSDCTNIHEEITDGESPEASNCKGTSLNCYHIGVRDENIASQGVSVHECLIAVEESKILIMETSSNANETEAGSLTSKSTISSVTHDQIGEYAWLSGEQKQLNFEVDEGIFAPPLLPKDPMQDAGYVQEYSSTAAHESDVKIKSCSKPIDAGKPKRRLLPASSLLVRGIYGLSIDDENDPPKGKRGQKNAADVKHRTQGSINLLRLLESSLPR